MTAPADPAAPDPPPPSGSLELGGLDAHQLLKIGLDTVVMPQGLDPDATVPVSQPSPAASGHRQPDLPLPEQLTELLPHGNYLVVGFLGQGGMGAVYKGTQVRLKRPVAIKIMRRDQGRDYDFEARFEREAQAMAKLNHPNIVSVIDFGEAGADYLYIVMELVEGADLMDVIRTGRMTQEMALSLLPQICDALQFAHDHGIVHRDIKPSNIMLTRDGRIKIADFGLAKHFDAESSFRTQTGTGMGTPDYAAPEQFNANAQIDHRADIYALGVMIYQMITGELPRGVWKAPSQRAQVDTQWDDIVSHAMQSDPSDRYQQASEIKTDVSSITLKTVAKSDPSPLGGERLGEGSASRTRKSRIPLFFGIIGLAAALAAGAFFGLRPSGDEVTSPAAAVSAASTTTAKQTLDLIALVDVQRDRLKAEGAAGKNEWTKAGGQLAFTSVDKRGGKICAPVALNGLRDYEIEVGLAKAPAAGVIVDLPISATNQATMAFVPGELVLIRDEKQKLQEIGKWPMDGAGSPWKLAARVKLDADGMNGTLSATVNGLPVGEWRGALGRLGRRTEQHPEFPGQFGPALYVPAGDLTYSSWTLRVRDGEAKVLRGASAPTVTASPEPAAIKLWDSADKLSKSRGIRWEDEAMRLDNAGSSSGPDSHNAILRASIRANPDAIGTVLALRMNDVPATQALLVVHLDTGKAGLTTATTGGVGLGEWSLPRAYAADEWVRVELRAIDDDFIVLVDGQVIGSAHSEALGRPGKAMVYAGANGFFRDIEYVPLDKQPAVATASAAGAWKPLFADKEWKATGQKAREFKDGLLHVTTGNADKPQPSADGAIRARIRLLEGTKDPSVKLRIQKAVGSYKLHLASTWDAIALSRTKESSGVENYGVLRGKQLPKPLHVGDSLLLELRVQGNHLTAVVDGVVMIEADDDTLPAPGQWGVSAVDGWFESVEVQTLPAAATPAPITATASSEPAAIKLWDSPEKLPKKPGVTWEDGVLKISSGSVNQLTPISRDSIARVSVRMNSDARRPELWLRKHSATNSGYKIALDVQGRKVAVKVVNDGVDPLLAQWPLTRTYAPNEWLKLEFRAVGNELTVSADGKVLGTVHDTARSQPGGMMLYAEANGYFRDIEYVPLDKQPAISSSPALPVSKSSDPKFPPGQWVKLFTKAEDLPAKFREDQPGAIWDGWIRAEGKYWRWDLPAELARNYGLRARFRRKQDSSSPNSAVKVRTATDMSYRCEAFVSKDGWAAVQKGLGLDAHTFFQFDGKQPIIAGDDYVLELAVVGQRVVCRLNSGFGSQVASDLRLEGIGSLLANEDVRDIEVINLDGLPEAEALRLLGVDEQGNDLRGKAGEAEVWQNLIALIKPATHTIKGNWEVKDGELICKASPWALCEIPVDYQGGSYDLRVTVTRGEGEHLALFFPFRKGDAAGDVVFDYFDNFSDGLKRAGLESLSRLKEGDPGSIFRMKSEWIPKGKRSNVLLRVRDEGIVVSLNGEEVFRWKADWAQLHQFKGFESALADGLNGRPVFGVGLFNCDATYHSIEMRKVTGEEARLLPLAAGAK